MDRDYLLAMVVSKKELCLSVTFACGAEERCPVVYDRAAQLDCPAALPGPTVDDRSTPNLAGTKHAHIEQTRMHTAPTHVYETSNINN